MKKSLLALAVLAAAGAANAQVTVYGTIDASIATVKAGGVNYTEQGNGDYLGSSVFGLKGSEDLGGGLKAFFDMQGDLNVNNGTGDGDATNTITAGENYAGGLTFDRQFYVGVSGSFGSIAVGRMSDLADKIQSSSEVGANLFDFKEADLGLKAPNTTYYTSPAIMGVTVHASYSNDTAAVSEGRAQGVSQSVVGVTGKVQDVGFGLASISRGATEGMALALDYDLGFAAVSLNHLTSDAAGVKSSDTNVGVKVPVGKGLNVLASIGRHNNDTATKKRSANGIMLVKDFSKRTSIYAGYASEDVDNGVTSDVETTTIGLQHKF